MFRPGGKIGLATWPPDSLIGELFRTVARFVPPPAGARPPVLWGTEDRLRELFGGAVASLRAARRPIVFRHRSVASWLEFNRKFFGPTIKAFETLDSSGQEALSREMADLMRRGNRSGDATLVAPSEYLEVVAVRV